MKRYNGIFLLPFIETDINVFYNKRTDKNDMNVYFTGGANHYGSKSK